MEGAAAPGLRQRLEALPQHGSQSLSPNITPGAAYEQGSEEACLQWKAAP